MSRYLNLLKNVFTLVLMVKSNILDKFRLAAHLKHDIQVIANWIKK